MSRRILGRKMRDGFTKLLKCDWRSRPKKIKADLSWDAVAHKYLEMFEEARRSNG